MAGQGVWLCGRSQTTSRDGLYTTLWYDRGSVFKAQTLHGNSEGMCCIDIDEVLITAYTNTFYQMNRAVKYVPSFIKSSQINSLAWVHKSDTTSNTCQMHIVFKYIYIYI